MRYCSNCGSSIDENAMFCSSCGSAVSTQNNQRTTEFDGTVHKCPACGEPLAALVSVCPTCGYELRDSKASDSCREFSQRLEKATNSDQTISIIRSFPIPNTKEDVYEFLILTASNLNAAIQVPMTSDTKNVEIANAWYAKLQQCRQKAKFAISDVGELNKIEQICQETEGQYRATMAHYKQSVEKENRRKESAPTSNYQQPQMVYVNQPPQTVYVQSPQIVQQAGMKDKWVAFVLCFFLGLVGAHKFYEKKIGVGILYIFTLGLFYIGWIVDLIKILMKPRYYIP